MHRAKIIPNYHSLPLHLEVAVRSHDILRVHLDSSVRAQAEPKKKKGPRRGTRENIPVLIEHAAVAGAQACRSLPLARGWPKRADRASQMRADRRHRSKPMPVAKNKKLSILDKGYRIRLIIRGLLQFESRRRFIQNIRKQIPHVRQAGPDNRNERGDPSN